MVKRTYRVAIVFPADTERRRKTRLEDSRFALIAAALADKGIDVEGAPYVDDDVEELRPQLMRVDGVLVWINPIVDGRDRTILDKMLGEVAASGVFVSAHPDVIGKIGTKEVLYRTRSMGWGCDTRHYPTFEMLQRDLPASLASGHARVLKHGARAQRRWRLEGRASRSSRPPIRFRGFPGGQPAGPARQARQRRYKNVLGGVSCAK